LNSRRAIRVPGGMVLGLAVNEAWVYEEPVAVLGTGETLNSRHHLAPESYTHSIDRDTLHPNSDHLFDQHMQASSCGTMHCQF
jgi:hypothetical protein